MFSKILNPTRKNGVRVVPSTFQISFNGTGLAEGVGGDAKELAWTRWRLRHPSISNYLETGRAVLNRGLSLSLPLLFHPIINEYFHENRMRTVIYADEHYLTSELIPSTPPLPPHARLVLSSRRVNTEATKAGISG